MLVARDSWFPPLYDYVRNVGHFAHDHSIKEVYTKEGNLLGWDVTKSLSVSSDTDNTGGQSHASKVQAETLRDPTGTTSASC